jgi:hypothetical protein
MKNEIKIATPRHIVDNVGDRWIVEVSAPAINPIKCWDYRKERAIELGKNCAIRLDRKITRERLQAAAPELLAFAKWAMLQFQGSSGIGETYWEQHFEYQAGRKAIAKAEGVE